MADRKEYEVPIGTNLYRTSTDTQVEEICLGPKELVPLTDTIIINTPIIKITQKKPGAAKVG